MMLMVNGILIGLLAVAAIIGFGLWGIAGWLDTEDERVPTVGALYFLAGTVALAALVLR